VAIKGMARSFRTVASPERLAFFSITRERVAIAQ
jgi:hypothetical protein